MKILLIELYANLYVILKYSFDFQKSSNDIQSSMHFSRTNISIIQKKNDHLSENDGDFQKSLNAPRIVAPILSSDSKFD